MPSIAIIPSTVGYHWEEVFAAYDELKAANWKISFFTVGGKPAKPDPKSLKKHAILSLFGIGCHPKIAPDTSLGKELIEKLASAEIIDNLKVDEFDAIYIPGGHGCLFDVNRNETVHEKIKEFYQKNKLIAAVCHGSSTLAAVKTNEQAIIAGKKITGFPDMLDATLIQAGLVDEKFLPLPFKNEAEIKKASANLSFVNTVLALLFPTYYRIDLPFITGMGPKATRNVIKQLISQVKT